MKKIRLLSEYRYLFACSRKIFRTMRYAIFILLFTAFQSMALDNYAQSKRFELKITHTTLADALDRIEQESDYFFFYNNKSISLDKKVSVDLKDKSINELLDALFQNTGISYTIKNRQIILSGENSGVAVQQDKRTTLTGKVVDKEGEPLPGVTVVVKGTTNGTMTDLEGRYRLAEVPAGATVVFSYIGMEKQEIAVGTQSVIDVVLGEATVGLEEVVAIGYGTVRKADLSGSVSAVKGDQIASRKATQVSNALQGTVAGVMVTRSNNAPGSQASIKVRGVTTINTSDPLVIVDGVPVDNINRFNADDIESISVLKDAASASIYGARAASGVIVVTTKRAAEGSLSLNYNYEYGIEKPTALPRYANVTQFMKMRNELSWNDNLNSGDEYSVYAQDVIDNYATLNAENPDLYPNTNWRKLILKDQAVRESHNLSIRAGNKNVRTNASIGYTKVDGLYKYRNFDRLTVRINNDFKINELIGATLDFNFSRSHYEYPSVDPIYDMTIAPPVYAAIWQNGALAEGKTGNNIYGSHLMGGTRDYYYNSLVGKAEVYITPFKGMRLSAVASPTYNFDQSKSFYKEAFYYSSTDPEVALGHLQSCNSTSLYEGRGEGRRLTTQLLANYNTKIGDHSINLLAGYEGFYSRDESLTASSDNFVLPDFPYLSVGPKDYRDNSGSAYENAYMSYFSRLIYSYKNRYLFQANIRRDGSSRFHPDYRWGNFPSFSAGWVMSEEEFMKNQDIVSNLKLRASWGSLGNERIGNYPYQSSIGFGSTLFYQGNTLVSEITAAQSAYVIRSISWETTETTDFGIDAGFLDNRLQVSADYYQKNTRDMLLTLQIPLYLGYDAPSQNTGVMKTKGFDLEMSWNDRIGKVTYGITANVSDFKSRMGDLGGTQFTGDQVKFEGSEFNEWYGYLSDGIYQTQDEVDNSATLNANVRPGDIRYKDISGPDGTPDGKISADYDKVLLGGSLPRYMFGGNINLGYKNFDFSMAFQGVGKQNVRLTPAMVQPNRDNWGNYQGELIGNYYSNYNTAEQNLAAKYPRLSQTGVTNNYAMSDFWMFNGRYVRLKSLTLGYTLPEELTKRANIKKLRVYATANDLFCLSKYPKGWDPEMNSYSYPITTTLLLGASINF